MVNLGNRQNFPPGILTSVSVLFLLFSFIFFLNGVPCLLAIAFSSMVIGENAIADTSPLVGKGSTCVTPVTVGTD